MPKKSRPPSYRRRTDGNHREIRNALRRAGWEVIDHSGTGNGIPDFLVYIYDFALVSWWCEVKVPGKELTELEKEFFDVAPGPKFKAESAEEALEFGRKLLESAK